MVIRTKRKMKFQETIGGIVLLGILVSAIWYYISPSENLALKNNIDNSVNSPILQGNQVVGDLIVGDKISNIISSSTKSNNEEYVFINNYCAITTSVNNRQVISYSITVLDKDFKFKIKLHNIDFYFGGTTFVDINNSLGDAGFVNGIIGGNWIHYNEAYYLARDGNYQSYIFSINENGAWLESFYENPPLFVDEDEIDMSSLEVRKFREKALPNTLTITSPFDGLDSAFAKKAFGLNRIQFNLYEKNIKKVNRDLLIRDIENLYIGSDIGYFIKKFGEPAFINKETDQDY